MRNIDIDFDTLMPFALIHSATKTAFHYFVGCCIAGMAKIARKKAWERELDKFISEVKQHDRNKEDND